MVVCSYFGFIQIIRDARCDLGSDRLLLFILVPEKPLALSVDVVVEWLDDAAANE